MEERQKRLFPAVFFRFINVKVAEKFIVKTVVVAVVPAADQQSQIPQVKFILSKLA